MIWLALLMACNPAVDSGDPGAPTPPPLSCFTDPSCTAPLGVAHRGGGWMAPENTLAGIEAAAAAGIRGVELDVRTSADGVLVLHHDDSVHRVTDGTGDVEALTLAELRALTVDGQAEPGGIPTFAEALALSVALDLAVDVDVKRASAEALAADIRGANAEENCFLLTKSVEAGESYRAVMPEVAIMPNLDHPENLASYAHLAPELMEVNFLDVAEAKEIAGEIRVFTHALGIEAAWVQSGDTAWRFQELREAGASILLTDFPVELQAAFVE